MIIRNRSYSRWQDRPQWLVGSHQTTSAQGANCTQFRWLVPSWCGGESAPTILFLPTPAKSIMLQYRINSSLKLSFGLDNKKKFTVRWQANKKYSTLLIHPFTGEVNN